MTHSVSFISDYGKLWEIFYTMEDRHTVGDILEIKINGESYHVTSFKRQEKIIEQAGKHGADLYENAVADMYEARETHHMID